MVKLIFYFIRNTLRHLAADAAAKWPLRTDGAVGVVAAESAGRPRCR